MNRCAIPHIGRSPDPDDVSTPVGGPVSLVVSLLSQFARPSAVRPTIAQPSIAPTGRNPWTTSTACQFGRTLLSAEGTNDSDLAHLEAAVDERVEVWTPAVTMTSRFELVATLTDTDDTIDGIEVAFATTASNDTSMFVEWRVTGRFSGPAFLDDDQLIEPTGALLVVDGTLLFSFAAGQRITRLSCQYDRLGLIQQMLPPSSSTIIRNG